MIPPRGYQRGDGQDVGQWTHGRCKQRYRGGGEPPVLSLFIVVWPESELPKLFRLSGRARHRLGLFDFILLGRRLIGRPGLEGAHFFLVVVSNAAGSYLGKSPLRCIDDGWWLLPAKSEEAGVQLKCIRALGRVEDVEDVEGGRIGRLRCVIVQPLRPAQALAEFDQGDSIRIRIPPEDDKVNDRLICSR